jgi:hypothetical protein
MKTNRTIINQGLFILAIFMLTIYSGCDVFGERGNGNVSSETRSVSFFNSIDVSGAFDVYITQGTAQSVIVETDENLQKLIKTKVEDNILYIETKEPISHSTCMKIHLTVTELKKIDVSGAVDIRTENKLTVPDLFIDGSGAADAKMDLAVQKLKIDCSGGSKIKFSGTAGEVRLDASGAVDLFAYDLVVESFYLEISGAGKAEINVTKILDAEISGAGTVRYKGNPEKVMENVSGAGSIKRAD